MRTIPVHPASFLLGAGLAAVALLIALPAFAGDTRRPAEHTPRAADMVETVEGTPYTVPAGATFVLTGVGHAQVALPCWFLVNGKTRYHVAGGAQPNGGLTTNMHTVPLGTTAPAGSVLAANAQGEQGRAWGYLERER